jgi:hypothetical protein
LNGRTHETNDPPQTHRGCPEGASRAAPQNAAAPFGFASRVAARWADRKSPTCGLDLYERLGWWGAALSSAICLVALMQRTTLPEPNPFDPLLGVDEVAAQPF